MLKAFKLAKKSAKLIFIYVDEKLLILREKLFKCKGAITYFPAFDSSQDLTNHFYRASWYLPHLSGTCEKAYLFQKRGRRIELSARPSYMCATTKDVSHISINKHSRIQFLQVLLGSRLILIWRNYNRPLWFCLRLIGIRSANISTTDLSSVEYGEYCRLFWQYLLNHEERENLIAENFERFEAVAREIADNGYKRSCVFGTGPSLENAMDFDFKGCLSIICNSTVQNSELIEHISPIFICAGDAVSHHGVSAYAKKFRDDLIRVLITRKIYFVTTAAVGFIFILNHPEARDKTILIEQKGTDPNYNLINDFHLPILDSTLNIHMLPLAATFTDHVFILGCDGKSSKRNNEDFWAHASKAQYHELVVTGHQCHPTFDVHREHGTYARYRNSVFNTIEIGEKYHGKKYWTLSQSNIQTLSERQIPVMWLREKKDDKQKVCLFPIF